MSEKKKTVFLPSILWENRKLIMNLAKNDYKKKFAGSYLGIIWAFIQPVVTVLVYWFVFEVGLNSKVNDLRTGAEVPFVIWLMAGLIPWFYFQEAWSGGTSVLIEYTYLVKKVVFQIETLPVVKLISALFTHLFFVTFTIILFAFMGYTPDLYTLPGFVLQFLHDRYGCRSDLCDKCDRSIFPGSCTGSGNLTSGRRMGDSYYVGY